MKEHPVVKVCASTFACAWGESTRVWLRFATCIASTLALLHAQPAVAETRKIVVDGIARTYEITRPTTTGPHPAVLMLHGGGGTASQLRKQSAFDEQVGAYGFVAIYAEGIAHGWEVPGPPPDSRRSQQSDLDFLIAVVDQLVAEKIVDPERVFAAGISNGGRMALNLACKRSARVRAVAIVAASLPEGSECGATAPVGVLMIQGTDDTINPMAGGDAGVGRIRRGRLLGLDATLAYWAALNGCGPSSKTDLPVHDANDPTRAARTRYDGCKAPVEAIVITGAGHTWPGAPVLPLVAGVVGTTSRQIDASHEIGEFFGRADRH